MFKTSVILSFLIGIAVIQQNIIAQEKTDRNRINTIVNLTRFVDWSQNESFNQSGKALYIITNKDSFKNFYSCSENIHGYGNWRIICSEKILDFENGSVVYLTKSKENFKYQIIRISDKKDILTISENTSDFCQNGGMINIRDNNGHVKFEINYRIIQGKSLDISSKLLALSKIYD